MTSHTQPWHIMSFEALTSGRSDSFGMVDCFIDKTPSVAIAMFQADSKGVQVLPLFVAITPGMTLSFPDRDGAGDSDSEEGGGPRRDELAEAFHAAKLAILTPGGGT